MVSTLDAAGLREAQRSCRTGRRSFEANGPGGDVADNNTFNKRFLEAQHALHSAKDGTLLNNDQLVSIAGLVADAIHGRLEVIVQRQLAPGTWSTLYADAPASEPCEPHNFLGYASHISPTRLNVHAAPFCPDAGAPPTVVTSALTAESDLGHSVGQAGASQDSMGHAILSGATLNACTQTVSASDIVGGDFVSQGAHAVDACKQAAADECSSDGVQGGTESPPQAMNHVLTKGGGLEEGVLSSVFLENRRKTKAPSAFSPGTRENTAPSSTSPKGQHLVSISGVRTNAATAPEALHGRGCCYWNSCSCGCCFCRRGEQVGQQSELSSRSAMDPPSATNFALANQGSTTHETLDAVIECEREWIALQANCITSPIGLLTTAPTFDLFSTALSTQGAISRFQACQRLHHLLSDNAAATDDDRRTLIRTATLLLQAKPEAVPPKMISDFIRSFSEGKASSADSQTQTICTNMLRLLYIVPPPMSVPAAAKRGKGGKR
eukprot:TRINITY_DN6458_c0_g1_i2.p1 TRINITY_DN6458_c0_g1~~TRINITY_DN6458_c0_g1_i2.p1  ORF type:complete len:495 (-),score=49.72 TRINITY_DN6458_c0_g1_i2:304-1788(-)